MRKFFIIPFVILMLFVLLGFKRPKQDIVLKFSAWGSQSEVALLLPLIKDFEAKNPDIKVDFIHVPQNYFQKIHLLFASNLAPDIVFVNNYYLPKYVKADLLEDVTGLVRQNDYYDKSIKALSVQGKLYAVPRDVSELVLYYNKDLFKKYGVSLPNENWTFFDYLNKVKSLTFDLNGDGQNDLWGTSYETDILFVYPYLLANDSNIFDANGNFDLNNVSTINALNTYSGFANKYNCAPKKQQSASLTMAQMFLQQKIAMHLSGRWLVPKYRADANFDWDIVTFPCKNGGYCMNIDASGYAISKKSKYKEQAKRFVEYISSKSALDKLAESGLIVPARIDSANSVGFLAPDKKPKHSYLFLKTVENGVVFHIKETYQKDVDKINTMLEPVFMGAKNAEDVLNNK